MLKKSQTCLEGIGKMKQNFDIAEAVDDSNQPSFSQIREMNNFWRKETAMKQSITTIKRNVIIFAILSTLCGWIGYVVDKITGQAHYENIGTEIGSGFFRDADLAGNSVNLYHLSP